MKQQPPKTAGRQCRCLKCEYARRLSEESLYCPFFACLKEPPPAHAPEAKGSG